METSEPARAGSDTRNFCNKKKTKHTRVISYFFSTVSERFDVTKYGLVWFRPGCVGTPPIKYYNHRFTVFYVQFYSKNQKKI